MEESKALSKLGEAADLLILLEDILNPNSIERLSASGWSGLRLTLRNARTLLQESQTTLSKDFVSRARTPSAISTAPTAQFQKDPEVVQSSENTTALITRRDLKASLEKFIESRA